MSRFTQSFVLGYHGCDREIAEKLLVGQSEIVFSAQPYDWLGSGGYFWEGDPDRAMEFANEQKSRGRYQNPAVVGAVIELRNCLNLSTSAGRSLLRTAYESLKKFQETTGEPMPENRSPTGSDDPDHLFRFLDNAVIQHLHKVIEDTVETDKLTPFDTVKSLFLEGSEIYPGAGFKEKSHIQIAVKNVDCIVGFFRPRSRET